MSVFEGRVVATAVRRGLKASPQHGETLVVAVSGGADSVALLDAVARLGVERGFRVVAAHLDHALRSDSAEDAAFCFELCRQLGVTLRQARADVRGRAERERRGLEDAARAERYEFLRRIAREEKAIAIAVAHTRDDQAETLLMRLLRGSGSVGLAGMHPRSGDLIRPLLSVSRHEILAYLHARGLQWREDPTNKDVSILRNRIRHELIPYLESRFNPRVREALARAAHVTAEEVAALGPDLDALWSRLARLEGCEIALSRIVLRSAPRALARVAIRRALEQVGGAQGIGWTHVEQLLELACAEAPSGRRLCLPGGREARFEFDTIRIGKRLHGAMPFAIPLNVPGSVALPSGETLVCSEPAPGDAAGALVPVPSEPLVVRTRRPGDRVRANGHDVSLKRFFAERRVPMDLRARLPLVTAGNRVLWIAGEVFEMAAREDERRVRLQLYRTETGVENRDAPTEAVGR